MPSVWRNSFLTRQISKPSLISPKQIRRQAASVTQAYASRCVWKQQTTAGKGSEPASALSCSNNCRPTFARWTCIYADLRPDPVPKPSRRARAPYSKKRNGWGCPLPPAVVLATAARVAARSYKELWWISRPASNPSPAKSSSYPACPWRAGTSKSTSEHSCFCEARELLKTDEESHDRRSSQLRVRGSSRHRALVGRMEPATVFAKLRVWQLVELDRVVLLDANTLVLQNADDLFERRSFAAAT